jgi:hypothetical protein
MTYLVDSDYIADYLKGHPSAVFSHQRGVPNTSSSSVLNRTNKAGGRRHMSKPLLAREEAENFSR